MKILTKSGPIKYLFILFLSFFCISSYACKSGIDEQYLFIQNAKKGEIIFNKVDQSYTIKLIHADPLVICFSKAPKRITEFTSEEDFIKYFNEEIKEKQPNGLNAGIIAVNLKNNKTLRYTLTLTHPTFDRKNHIVTYTARMLPGDQASPPLPEKTKIKHVSLFIDACSACGGSGF